jgi:hypothetical protein
MRYGLILLLCVIISCDAKKDAPSNALVRVYDQYLSREAIVGLVPPGTSKADSAIIVNSFVNRWASQQLLLNAANVNLTKKQQAALDALVKEYQSDLYAKAYLEEIVKRMVDTVVSEKELTAYYASNKENFRANNILVKLRYLHIQKDNPKYAAIRAKFFDFRKSDRKFWENYSMQMKSFAFNDSVWVDASQIYAKLPFITPENIEQNMTAGKAIEQPIGADMYLVEVLNVIGVNDVAPYSYLKPTLKDIIVNSRKLELIKKFELDMTADAIKEKNYEIYK